MNHKTPFYLLHKDALGECKAKTVEEVKLLDGKFKWAIKINYYNETTRETYGVLRTLKYYSPHFIEDKKWTEYHLTWEAINDGTWVIVNKTLANSNLHHCYRILKGAPQDK